MTRQEILSHVDHTLLKPEATWPQIQTLCDEAVENKTASICINTCYVKQAVEYLAGRVPVCCVVGFPLGAMDTASKAFEAKTAIENGAEEVDIKGFHDVMEAQRALSQQVLVMREIPATAEVADYLEIQEGTQIAEIHRVLEEGGIPLLLDRCYIPLNRFPDFLTYAKGNFSIYKILRENYHVTMEKAEKVLKVRKVNKKECLYLQCKIGEPVFDIFTN